jgi:Tfp pilus assembly protein PilX
MHGGMPTRLKRIARALGGGRLQSRLLADERGIALVMALGILVVLTILGTSVFSYSTINAHSTRLSQERSSAWDIAEAGVNNAFSILSDPTIDARQPTTLSCGGSRCQTNVPGGYALWQGRLVETDASGNLLQCVTSATCPYWIVTSTGYVRNPDASTPAWKTAIVKIPITWQTSSPQTSQAWSEIMSTQQKSPDGVCDETIQQGVVISSPLYVMGNLCLQNTVSIQQSPLNVVGSIWLQQPNSVVGIPANGNGTPTKIAAAHIGGKCQYQSNGFHSCGGGINSDAAWQADNIYATTHDSNYDQTITAPTINWAYWYKTASPGPMFPCAIVSGSPPVYSGIFGDVDTTMNNSLASAPGPVNLTPASSYTCKNSFGELSWNATTNVLTITGAVYIDGSASIVGPTGGFTARVNPTGGRGVLYLTGDFFMKNAILCVTLTANQKDCNTTGWDPNQSLFMIITKGSGGQPSTNMDSADGVQLVSAIFQGAAYAVANIATDTTSKFYGPMLGNQVNLGQSVNTQFPAITVAPFALDQNGDTPATPQKPVYLNG